MQKGNENGGGSVQWDEVGVGSYGYKCTGEI